MLTSSNDLLSSTYYILDAQGNVMSTYNLNVDTVNTSLTYFQAEKYIYGSSRLGMLKDSVNVLGSAYTNTDTSNFVHTLGNKRYELSNHLGNVLTVISDKPIPHNNGGTVDYFMADIKSAYDYSPFGVMLTGRTFEGRETVCHDSTIQATQNALEESFGTWGSWTAMADGLVTYVADEMQVSNPSTSKKNIGASKTFTTGEGLHSVSFKVIGNMCSNIVFWPPSNTPIPIQVIVRDNANNIVASGNYTAAGSYNLSFTPVSSGATYKIEFYMANASALCFFRVDDVLVSYEDESVLTVCKEVDGFYPYSFQGQLRDDEIKGKGNSYDFGARMYDSRLGRFLSIDPAFDLQPSEGVYNFAGNSPIFYIDCQGNFKWPGTAQEQKALENKYPKFTKIMMNIHKMPELYPNLIDELSKSTGLKPDQIIENLKYGNGATIIVSSEEGANTPNKSEIHISEKMLTKFESLSGDDLESGVVLMGILLLHEETHRGDRITNDGKISGQYTYKTVNGLVKDSPETLDEGKQEYKKSLTGHRGTDLEIKVFGAPGGDLKWRSFGEPGKLSKLPNAGYSVDIDIWGEPEGLQGGFDIKKTEKDALKTGLGSEKIKQTFKLLNP
ncbi:MAG: hypothetical protein M9916_07390 [Crocinitomicaceae bacterium]|nr:hypothetical protein [Crocinitomicaceae bacterium]